MRRLLYNLLFPLALLALLPGYLLRMVRRGNFRAHFGERFGRYDAEARARLAALPQTGRLWIHAVSVGEMLVALKLAAALRARAPAVPLIFSTTTVTGRALAEERAPAGAVVLYAPLDVFWVVPRAFAAIRPARLALVEAEVWPNWLHQAGRRGVPVHLVNARLSPRSERRFQSFRWFAAPFFRQLAEITVPEPADIARWENLGAEQAHVVCLGSIKFDETATPMDATHTARFRELLSATGVQTTLPRPVLLGGSTHPGEEALLARVWQSLRPEFPDLLLLIAPRHVERTNALLDELHALGLRVARRSLLDRDFTLLEKPDVLLLDTTGELRDWYPLAHVVFIGKSLASSVTGGQNPAEPLAAGIPTICGPHMENFADLVAKLRAADGLVQITDEAGLTEAVRGFLRRPEEGNALAKRGAAALAQHRGATERNAARLSG